MGTDSPTSAGGSSSGFDISSINRNDLGVMIAGAVAFIASFLPYLKAEVKIGAVSASSTTSAWHSYATLGLILIFAGAVVIAIKTFAEQTLPGNLPVGLHVVAAALAAVGTLLVILRAFTEDSGVPGLDISPSWGGYILFVAGIAETVFAILGMRESGEEIPGLNRGGAAPPAPPAA